MVFHILLQLAIELIVIAYRVSHFIFIILIEKINFFVFLYLLVSLTANFCKHFKDFMKIS